jgi:hypothetical protein
MQKHLRITAEWESLDQGAAEERCCFAALAVVANDIWLTEGLDVLVNRLRRAPLLSGYHFAEWIAWNWWRLRWEPHTRNEEWRFAHKTSNIGGGYIWPNITIFSDGKRTALIARSSRDTVDTSFRYINNVAAVVPSVDFESEIDNFVEQVLSRLESFGIVDTNLSRLWTDVRMERDDPEIAKLRKLEALLGKDADNSNADKLDGLIEDSRRLGDAAIEEIAADSGHAPVASLLSAGTLLETARSAGYSASPHDMVRLSGVAQLVDDRSGLAAWQIGARNAQMLRRQANLGEAPIEDQRLSEMFAIDSRAIGINRSTALGISFEMDLPNQRSLVVLRSNRPEGRRFEIARLLGDRLMNYEGQLFPATRAYTYRQKVQRSFAAELLSPFDSVMHMLQGDYSLESQLDVAEHFQVSELTIRTQLVNHKILDREDLEPDSVSRIS